MAVLCRWILILAALLATGLRLAAESAADRAFDAAYKAFHDTIYDRAEAGFADFCQKYPDSPRLAEAILLQAEARLQLSNYAGAIALLSAHQKDAGTNADKYVFWLTEAQLRKGDYRAASDGFAKLVKEFPASSHLLDAAMGEASAEAALARAEPSEWPRVIQLLQQTNGVFQCAARTNAGNELVVRGQLLLSEAQLATKDYRAAEEILQPLAKRLLSPRLAWQWLYLLCHIQLADGRTDAALQSTTNLLAAAANVGQTNLLADSTAFQASLFERLGRTNEAIVAYQKNLAEGIPAERKRQALLKIIELSLALNQIPQAAQTLEKFLSQSPDDALADLALLTLGELRLRQSEAGVDTNLVANASTNAAAATNNLQLALASFTTLVKKYPQSPLFGKAQLDLGWCFWRGGKMAESQAAFQAAVERLPFSKDLATAYFRLADTQFQQTNYAGAIKNYQAIIEKLGALPEVRTNLFEPSLYQTVRASVAGGDLATATNTLQKMLAWYSNHLDTARAVLLTGQEIGLRGDPAGARRMFLDFAKTAPDAPLLPELQLAVAATYEQEKKWPEAIAQYDNWLTNYTNNALLPRAEYYRALDTDQAGLKTNALAALVKFVAKYPTNEFAPLAQWWVAVYYYNAREMPEAELNYKLLFQSTNWPPSELTYRAQLMAGYAAVARQGWKDVHDYFTGLVNNTNGPNIDLRVQALFDYGRSLMQWTAPTETNKLANCEEATRVFGRICDEYPTNRLAVAAWIEKANCYLQWALARQQYDSLTNALYAYQRVIDSPQADAALRSQAKLGQAITLGKWAEQKTGETRTALLKQALSNCLDVVYGNILRDDEQPDASSSLAQKVGEKAFEKVAEKAFELAEALQAWSQAANIYMRLTNSVWPVLDPSLRNRATNVFENLKREKENR
ncbi:MAG: tetratricopeptide repeat protein [Limisphaerales bacterium]